MTQLDRIEKTLIAIYEGLFKKTSPFKVEDDAPAQQRVPVEGFEKVFGPKPHPSAADYRDWFTHVPNVLEVATHIPAEIVDGVLEFVAETKRKPVFFNYNGVWLAMVDDKPNARAWTVDLSRFQGSNVQGLIRAVKGPQVP